MLLVLGALVGLFGQSMAYAIGPSKASRIEATHVMASGMDCEAMTPAHEEKSKQPCKGLTLACIADMGCIVPLTISEPPHGVERAAVAQPVATWPLLATLVGLEIAPEDNPPNA